MLTTVAPVPRVKRVDEWTYVFVHAVFAAIFVKTAFPWFARDGAAVRFVWLVWMLWSFTGYIALRISRRN